MIVSAGSNSHPLTIKLAPWIFRNFNVVIKTFINKISDEWNAPAKAIITQFVVVRKTKISSCFPLSASSHSPQIKNGRRYFQCFQTLGSTTFALTTLSCSRKLLCYSLKNQRWYWMFEQVFPFAVSRSHLVSSLGRREYDEGKNWK